MVVLLLLGIFLLDGCVAVDLDLRIMFSCALVCIVALLIRLFVFRRLYVPVLALVVHVGYLLLL